MKLDYLIDFLKQHRTADKINLHGRREEIEAIISALEELKEWRINHIEESVAKSLVRQESANVDINVDTDDIRRYVEETGLADKERIKPQWETT